jgi:hypothetical protein
LARIVISSPEHNKGVVLLQLTIADLRRTFIFIFLLRGQCFMAAKHAHANKAKRIRIHLSQDHCWQQTSTPGL